jgi:nicotinamide mononucleotide adenylyltransferase
MLLAGGDLVLSFAEPGLWQDEDVSFACSTLHRLVNLTLVKVQEILQVYGCCVVERTGSDIHSFLIAHDALYEHRVRFDACSLL